MKKVLYIIMAFALLLGTASCSEWLNVNTDPDNPSNQSATPEIRLPWIQYYYGYAYGSASTRGGAASQIIMGTSRTGTVGRQGIWDPTTGVSTTVYQNFFIGAACNIPDLITKAQELGAYHYVGAALTIKSMGFVMMADLYGEMPYTWAVSEDFSPAYDNGDVIYAGCLKDLDSAIEYFKMNQEPGSVSLAEGDTWCGGDVNKWIKLCYALKARWLNNLTKVTEAKSGLKYDPAAILEAANSALSSNADNVLVKHANVETAGTCITVGDAYGPNLVWDSAAWGTGQRLQRWFVQLLTNFQGSGVLDPRAEKIIPSSMYKVELDAEGGKIVSHEWLLDEGIDVSNTEEGWNNNRVYFGNFNGYLALAKADVTKKYANSAILKYYKSIDAFIAGAKKYYSDKNITIAQGADTVAITYHPGAMYVNDTNPLYVEDVKYVQLRADAIFETAGLAANDMNCYYSLRSADTRALGFVQGTGSFYARPDSDTEIFTYAEILFIKAEVYFRQGNTAEAYKAYREGILAHFERMNTKLASWTAAGCGKTARSFDVSFAYSPIPQADIDAYMASPAVAQSAGQLTLSDIMMQKVIALGIAYQTWNDVRRYNFGSGTVGNYGVVYEGMKSPAYRAYTSSVFSADPKKGRHYMRRWLQCSHETNYNATEVKLSAEQYKEYGVKSPLDFSFWSIPVWWDWDDTIEKTID